MMPSLLPTMRFSRIAGTSTTRAVFAVRKNGLSAPWRRRCHADTPSITSDPVTSDASTTCTYPHTNTGFVNTAPMLFSTGRFVVGSISYPTGCCIHEFAAMMNAAERTPPNATSQIVARWIRFGSRSQPNSQRPRNVDSRKKAASPSMASGAPNTSPT